MFDPSGEINGICDAEALGQFAQEDIIGPSPIIVRRAFPDRRRSAAASIAMSGPL
ncbi:hypothetical protein ACFSLT_03860 [Novosphingobium resinovorum]